MNTANAGPSLETRPVTSSDLDSSDSARSTFELVRSPWTLLLLALGLAARFWVLFTRQGRINADETFTMLQAQEVLDGRFRVVIPDLVYTATFDSYVLAPLTAIFGQQTLILKLYPSLWLALVAFMVTAIVRRLVNDRAAVLAGAMTWLAPGALAIVWTRGYESYPSGVGFVTATALATLVHLEAANDTPRRRALRSALVGGLAGFAFYLHPMYVAVLFPMLLVPCWKYRRQLTEWWLPFVAALIGANVPFLTWNALNGWPSLSQPAAATDGPLDRFVRFFTGLIPRSYGLRGQLGEWVFGAGVSIVLLLAFLALLALGSVQLWRAGGSRSLVVLVPLVASWFLMAGFTNLAFVTDGRYGMIGYPFVMCALGAGVDRLLPDRRGMVAAAVCAWIGVLLVPFLVQESGIEVINPNGGVLAVVDHLEDRDIDRVIGYYWWVLPIEFLSDQRIRSATSVNPDVVTLPDTQRLVESSDPEDVAFVFWRMEEDTGRLMMPIDRYERTDFGEVIVYVPLPQRAPEEGQG